MKIGTGFRRAGVLAAVGAAFLGTLTFSTGAQADADTPGQGHYCATPSQMNFYPGIKTDELRYGDVSIAITACKNAWVSSWMVDASPITNGIGLTARHEILTQRINGPINENGRTITIRILMKFCPRASVCYYPAKWDVTYDFSRDKNQDVVMAYTVTRIDNRIGYALYDTPRKAPQA